MYEHKSILFLFINKSIKPYYSNKLILKYFKNYIISNKGSIELKQNKKTLFDKTTVLKKKIIICCGVVH